MIILKWDLENCESIKIDGEWCLKVQWPWHEVAAFCSLFGVSSSTTWTEDYPGGYVINNLNKQPYGPQIKLL